MIVVLSSAYESVPGHAPNTRVELLHPKSRINRSLSVEGSPRGPVSPKHPEALKSSASKTEGCKDITRSHFEHSLLHYWQPELPSESMSYFCRTMPPSPNIGASIIRKGFGNYI